MSKSIYNRMFKNDDEGTPYSVLNKFDQDLNPAGSYNIHTMYTGEKVCNCPARVAECRHIKMLRMFDNAETGNDDVFQLVQTENPTREVWLQTDNKSFVWIPTINKQGKAEVS